MIPTPDHWSRPTIAGSASTIALRGETTLLESQTLLLVNRRHYRWCTAHALNGVA